MKELKMNQKKQENINNKKPTIGNDFEKLFGKDIDDFLDESDWALDSLEQESHLSKGNSQSGLYDGRLSVLEGIYL